MSPQMAVLLGLAVALVVFGLLLWKYDQPRGHGTVEVTITADTSRFDAAMSNWNASPGMVWNLSNLTRFATAANAAAVDLEVSMRKVIEAMRAVGVGGLETPAEREVRVAGLAAKMQVRAGMDPTVELDTLLRQIRAHRNLTYEERGLVAAAALRGWAEHRDTGRPDSVAFNRLLCGHHVEVAAAVGGVS
jgi:hypothetical protein